MKMIITGILLAMLGVNASASDWKHVASSSLDDIAIEMQSIQSFGKLRKAWFLSNRRKPEVVPGTPDTLHQSAKFLAHISCSNKTIATAAIQFFSEKDAGGTLVGSSNIRGDFFDIPPDSVNEALMTVVCAKRVGRG